MSVDDFWAGRQAANIANRTAISEWQTYAADLEQRLERSNLAYAKAESGRIGFAHLLKMVAEQLRRVDPENPLLQRENQLKVLGEKAAITASEMGYAYDFEKGTVVGKMKRV